MANPDLIAYYHQRAPEYDDVYRKPERQADIAALTARLTMLLADREVLEVACGTGFWSARLAPHVRRLVGTDVNESVLALARARLCGSDHVCFRNADAYQLEAVGAGFTAGFAGFWLSHVPTNRLVTFLEQFEAKLEHGAQVVIADNRYVEGSSSLVTRVDPQGNSYQLRRLNDGSEYEVLKNFQSQQQLETLLGARGNNLVIDLFQYFWCASYRL